MNLRLRARRTVTDENRADPRAQASYAYQSSAHEAARPIRSGKQSVLDKIGAWFSSWFSSSSAQALKSYQPERTNYAKLHIQRDRGVNTCHGAFITNQLVLTASHCLPDYVSTVTTRYGREFQHTAITHRDDKNPNWIKLDRKWGGPDTDTHQKPAPDLALVKLPKPVTKEEGVVVARIPAQEQCGGGSSRTQAYIGARLPTDRMAIRPTTAVPYIAVSGWGETLRMEDDVVPAGNSGSPLMSTTGEQVGVLVGVGTASHSIASYAVALCKYSDAIKTHAARLGGERQKRRPGR